MYVNQLRWLSFVGHDLKEPFSLLAKDIPAPELPPELDELAQKRALQYFRVILLTVSTLSVGLPIITCKSSKDHSKPRNEVDTSLKSPV